MSLDWVMSPLTMYGALAAGLCACVYLFLADNAAVHTTERRLRSEIQELRDTIALLSKRVTGLEAELEAGAMAPIPRTASLNVSKRLQALRMFRRGEPAEAIAAALGLARSEVALMLKINKIVIESMSHETEARPAAQSGGDQAS